jgi:hypothetical protein
MDPFIPEPPESPRLFRPRTVGEILRHAFELYGRHWRNLLAMVAFVVIPLAIAQALIAEFWLSESVTRVEVRGGVEVTVGGAFWAAIALSLVILLFSVLGYTALEGAITRAAAGTFLGRDMDIGESLRFGLSRFWSIILVGVLVGLAIVGGFLLLVVPAFVFLTRFWVSVPALVIEDRRGREALKRSWNLVKGHSWPVFGTILVVAIGSGLVNGLLTAPFGDSVVARAVGGAIASILTTPYVALVGVLIYLDVRVRKEQYGPDDLEAELARTRPT